MITPTSAIIILVSFVILFGVAMPVLDVFAKKFISYRWSVVVIVLAAMIGALVDFEKISDETRRIIIFGGLIISGVYVIIRTVEKALANGWLSGATLKVKKGDIEAEIHSDKRHMEGN